MENKLKLAFFVSHPIQYFSPLFRKLSTSELFELKVYYFSDETLKEFNDKQFGKKIKWDIDLIGGYEWEVLQNNSFVPTIYKPPFGLINSDIKKIIKESDIIIIHGWNYISHLLVFYYSFIYKKPLFLRAEMPLKQEFLKSFFKRKIKKFFMPILFKRVSAFLAIGKENTKFFQYYGVDTKKIYFAPYAIDNIFFRSKYIELKHKKDKLKQELKIEQYEKIILFVGKLINKKRPMDLLKAFAKNKMDNTALLFVGSGELEKELYQYINRYKINNVYLMGFQNQTELPKFYTVADLFVLPSGIGETWGLVVNEAMNYELPILVSSTVGCSNDLVRDNGDIFEEGNIDELAHKIQVILNSKDIDSKRKRSYDIIKNYSYDNIKLAIEMAIKDLWSNKNEK